MNLISKFKNNSRDKLLSFGFLLKVFFLLLSVQFILVPFILVCFLMLERFRAGQVISIDVYLEGWLNVLTMVLNFLILFGFLLTRDRKIMAFILMRDREFQSRNEVKNFLIGVASCLLYYPFLSLLGHLIGLLLDRWFAVSPIPQEPVKMVKMLEGDPALYIVINVCVGIFIPMTEELLFRGFLQSWFRERMRPFLAILIASLLFSLVHYSTSQGLSNIQYLIPLFVLSCFLGIFYERSRSLLTPIGLHLAFNVISLLFIWIS